MLCIPHIRLYPTDRVPRRSAAIRTSAQRLLDAIAYTVAGRCHDRCVLVFQIRANTRRTDAHAKAQIVHRIRSDGRLHRAVGSTAVGDTVLRPNGTGTVITRRQSVFGVIRNPFALYS